jgi:hypothetical protein
MRVDLSKFIAKCGGEFLQAFQRARSGLSARFWDAAASERTVTYDVLVDWRPAFWPVGLLTGKSLKALVGPPGFEPGTSCTPSKRASQAAPRPDLETSFSFYHNNLPALPPTERWPPRSRQNAETLPSRYQHRINLLKPLTKLTKTEGAQRYRYQA